MTVGVVLQPCGNDESWIHFENTIQKRVSLEDPAIRRLLGSEADKIESELGSEVAFWGVVPSSERNIGSFGRMKVGDRVLFGGKGRIFLSGKVAYKLENRELAEHLWTVDENGLTWSLMYAIEKLEKEDIPYSVFNMAVGYSDGAVIQGFGLMAVDKAVLAEAAFFSGGGERRFVVGREYRDKAAASNKEDEFSGWINIPDSGIGNSGGIRGLRSLRTGVNGIDGLVLVTTRNSESGYWHNPWEDDSSSENELNYWGDAKAGPKKGIYDFRGNRLLQEVHSRPISNRPFILHFTRNKKGWVEFTGLYVMIDLEESEMIDGDVTVKNLKANLRRTSDSEVTVSWLEEWRTKDSRDERLNKAPKGWLEYLSEGHIIESMNGVSNDVEAVRCNIPSSFVSRPLKISRDRGSGEAKLYVGPVRRKAEYDQFFGGWHPLNTYEFDHVSLLLYMQDVEPEFSKSSKYKAVSRKMFGDLMREIEDFGDLRVRISSHTDQSRYYIRGDSAAWDLLRRIAIPLMSELVIEMVEKHANGYADYSIRLERSRESRDPAKTSGRSQGPEGGDTQIKRWRRKEKKEKSIIAPEDKRTIPQDLKDLVWKRDEGVCQANWRIDRSLDKNTGERCDSNEWIEFDHMVPFSKGGKTTYRNLQLLCRKHNRMKGARET